MTPTLTDALPFSVAIVVAVVRVIKDVIIGIVCEAKQAAMRPSGISVRRLWRGLVLRAYTATSCWPPSPPFPVLTRLL